MSKPKTYSELARAMTREEMLQHQRYHEQREKCREMERELDEAIALMIEQPISYVVPDYDMSKPSAPDFNGETP